MDLITLALAKKYAGRIGSTITGTSYDYDTGKLTFDTVDGLWEVRVNNGMSASYKNTLDNVRYDNTSDTLQVNGAEVLTKDDEASGDINFDDFFD